MSHEENGSPDELERRVASWLEDEGHPLEFKTAQIYHEAGYSGFLGHYVDDPDTEAAREIDVVGYLNKPIEDHNWIRLWHVVECKTSKSKPWVVLTSDRNWKGPDENIAQTFGSFLGQSVLWWLCGDDQLRKLEMFRSPARAGFGGRVAFAGQNDQFYDALRSVTRKADLQANSHLKFEQHSPEVPHATEIAAPVIVFDGQLFEAFYDRDKREVRTEKIDYCRLNWRGAGGWRHSVVVDLVRYEVLADYLASRRPQELKLLDAAHVAVKNIKQCAAAGSLEPLNNRPGSPGYMGPPGLLRRIYIDSLPKEEKESDGQPQ